MLNECNGCEYQCNLSHIDICTLGSPCPHQRSTPMTEQEWLQTADTEQLADVLAKQKCDGCNDEPYDEEHSTCKYCMMQKREQIMEWLKQPHTNE